MFRAIVAACVSLSLAVLLTAASAQEKDKDKEKEKKEEKEKKKDPLEEKILDKTIGEWIKILRTHEETRYRRAALLALEYGDAATRTGLPAILNAVEKDKEPQIRLEAVQLLGRLGPKANGSLKALVEAMQTDKAGEVREAAATALGNEKFIGLSGAYVAVFAEALKDGHTGTRIAVASALRDLGEGARPAFPGLFAAAKNPKEHALVRAAAIHVLSRKAKEDSQTVPMLLEILKTEETPAALREAAVDGLGRSGSDSADVIAALGATLGEKSLDMRKAGAGALFGLGSKAKAAWPAVKERLADEKENSGVRNHLIRFTGTLAKDNTDAVKTLTEVAVVDKSTENRIAAIQELGELGNAAPKETRETLRRISRDDARAAIREAAEKAIKQIDG